MTSFLNHSNICWGTVFQKAMAMPEKEISGFFTKNPDYYEAIKDGITQFKNENIKTFLFKELYKIESLLNKQHSIHKDVLLKREQAIVDHNFEFKVLPFENNKKKTEVLITNTYPSFSDELMKEASIKGDKNDWVNIIKERHFSKYSD